MQASVSRSFSTCPNPAPLAGVIRTVNKLPAQAAVGYARRKGWIDIRGGLALLRSRDVPSGHKVSAITAMAAKQACAKPKVSIAQAKAGVKISPAQVAPFNARDRKSVV